MAGSTPRPPSREVPITVPHLRPIRVPILFVVLSRDLISQGLVGLGDELCEVLYGKRVCVLCVEGEGAQRACGEEAAGVLGQAGAWKGKPGGGGHPRKSGLGGWLAGWSAGTHLVRMVLE